MCESSTCRGHRGAFGFPLELVLQTVGSCCAGPLEEQSVLLAAEPSLQYLEKLFVLFCLVLFLKQGLSL